MPRDTTIPVSVERDANSAASTYYASTRFDTQRCYAGDTRKLRYYPALVDD